MRVRVYEVDREDDTEDSYQAPIDAVDAYMAARARARYYGRLAEVTLVVEPLDDEAVAYPYAQWNTDSRGRFAVYEVRPRVTWEATRCLVGR